MSGWAAGVEGKFAAMIGARAEVNLSLSESMSRSALTVEARYAGI